MCEQESSSATRRCPHDSVPISSAYRPADTKVGEKVAVAFYCPTPYLIRKNEENPNFRMVGESYAHGLMYSEALDMFDKGEVQESKWEAT
jgi:hypothetical protein